MDIFSKEEFWLFSAKDLHEWVVATAPNVLALLVAGWFLRHFGIIIIRRVIKHSIRITKYNDMTESDVKKRQDTLISLLDVVWRIFIGIVVALMLFKVFFPSINLTPLFASAGILGVALGFGAQSLIKDFLTGVFIITENQYRVGDIVDIEGASGTVEKLGIRSTVLRDADGNVHYLPNGNVMHVINKTMGFSKVNFAVAVKPSTDVDALAKIINDIGDKLAQDEKWQAKIIDPPHFFSIGTYSDLSLEVNIVGKVQPSEQWSVSAEMRRRLLSAFKKHKVELAHSINYSMQQSRK
ncbi:MAG: Mechanosensitive ion channel family protein [Patescibacteria group bacterium]|nr:mechanosensitive ion channel family protein [Candidatus Saccharibacteria bacterium]MDQ5963713.1 Mechanosensitive ion channel family protein [Patescibacteria group bacterium]